MAKLWVGQSGVPILAGAKIYLFSNMPRPAVKPIQPPNLNGYQGFYPRGKSGQEIRLTIHLHLAPKLRMGGRTPAFLLHALMACTATALSV